MGSLQTCNDAGVAPGDGEEAGARLGGESPGLEHNRKKVQLCPQAVLEPEPLCGEFCLSRVGVPQYPPHAHSVAGWQSPQEGGCSA